MDSSGERGDREAELTLVFVLHEGDAVVLDQAANRTCWLPLSTQFPTLHSGVLDAQRSCERALTVWPRAD